MGPRVFWFFNLFLILFCMRVCFARAHICAALICPVPAEPEERAGSPGTGWCEEPFGYQELNLGPVEARPVLSITEL